MAGRDIVRITFKDAIGTESIRSDFLTSMTLFDLYEKVAQVTRRKISKLLIQMSGPFMSTVLEKSHIQTIQSISGAFVNNEITPFVVYDMRGGSSRKRKRRRTKRRKTNKKRRTNRRK